MAVTPRPSTPVKQQHMMRDERIRANASFGDGWTYLKIADKMGKNFRQIKTACTSLATPEKRSGRRPTITKEMRHELVAFVCASQEHRLTPYNKMLEGTGWDVFESQICRALHK
jgi:hypothetical protein